MEIKNLDQFLNESHTVDYLSVIINKLRSEGKSIKDVYIYLDLLNIPKERIIQSMHACGCAMHEAVINEEGELDDLIDDVDDEADKDKKDTEEEKEKEEPKEDDKDEKDSSDNAKKKALRDAVEDIEMVAKAMSKVKSVMKSGADADDDNV